MADAASFEGMIRKLGWVEKVFIVLVAIYVLLVFVAPNSGWLVATQLLAFVFGVIVGIRLLRMAARHAIWRVRNRLIVTYLFIGGVPILLIGALVALGLYAVVSQVAVFLYTSELERRIEGLQAAAKSIVWTEPAGRVELMRRMSEMVYRERFPGVVMILRSAAGVTTYPADATITAPPPEVKAQSGVCHKDGINYIWAHTKTSDGDVTVLAPMETAELSDLVPHLGMAELLSVAEPPTVAAKVRKDFLVKSQQRRPVNSTLPPPQFRFDIPVSFGAITPIVYYNDTGSTTDYRVLFVTTRLSAVYDALFSRKTDSLQEFVTYTFIIVSVTFLVVELISLYVGISMTRTITGTVHKLYAGTQHVIQGDFSHRIEVKGNDQLSTLAHSFNDMTHRIENLLAVAKEKERLQSEIEIASEVQSQLYPKKIPDSRALRLTAVCKPARMVSGDYFDYECLHDNCVALAVGDVAGKGISAALLMATLQSSLRTELRGFTDLAVAAGGTLASSAPVSTSALVKHLNGHLHANTSPEKYATFFLGIFDEPSSVLRYTNAGHLPPILIRDGEATRLNVDGTVVGAFPFAQYDESEVKLERGDLLVCFTDGVSEPENEFGEMFGEDRLVELCVKNAHRPASEIVETIIASVEQWTGSPELQDDLTLLLARRE